MLETVGMLNVFVGTIMHIVLGSLMNSEFGRVSFEILFSSCLFSAKSVITFPRLHGFWVHVY